MTVLQLVKKFLASFGTRRLYGFARRLYGFHNNPPLVSIINQKNTAHTLPSYLSNTRFNIILLSKLSRQNTFFLVWFLALNTANIYHLSPTRNMSHPSLPPRIHLPSTT
jgi:hypothetical protein